MSLPPDPRRYLRHLLLPEVGGQGQARLAAARVLIVGCGGLGSPAALYLAAAGVGSLRLVDDDAVELANLQRQILHCTASLGRLKVESAAETLADLNPDVRLEPVAGRLTAASAPALLAGCDLALDGSDNFATRLALNDACRRAGVPLVTAAIQRFEGQITTVRPDGPCWRCLFPEMPAPGEVADCASVGILGPVAGVLGTLQAVEALKELLGLGQTLAGRLLLYDGLAATLSEIAFDRDPDCSACAAAAVGAQ